MNDLSYDPFYRIYQTTSTKFEGIDDFFATTAIGSVKNSMAQVFSGINHRGTPNRVPMNKDYFGLAFFTRPDMNMTTKNLLRDRRFTQLLTNNHKSIPRAIRAYLDYRCDENLGDSHTSPLVDNRNIFIPLLTNHLVSMSGWPDIDVPTFSSDAGVVGDAIAMVDGEIDILGVRDMTCNFRNMPGSPILSMAHFWQRYMASVFKGSLLPYPNNMVENTKDYETRIYRLVLDNTKRFVQDIAVFNACFPVTTPYGAKFNFETDTPINRSNDQISITFRGSIVEYSDDILINEFNKAVILANTDMADLEGDTDGYRNQRMVKVSGEYLHHFNYSGYPRINPGTSELEWWIDRADFDAIAGTDGANAETAAGDDIGQSEDYEDYGDAF